MRWVGVFVVSLVLAACWSPGDGIARVGEHRIELQTFQEYVAAATGEPWEQAGERVATGLLDQFLDEEVVLVAAEGVDPSGAPGHRLEERSALVRELVVDVCGPAQPPGADDVRGEVDRRLAEDRPLRARVRQLLFRDAEAARRALESLESGVSWVRVSRMFSEAPNADNGGSLGVVTRGELPPSVEPVVFALEEGEWSRAVRGPGGYHVFQVLRRFEPEAPQREIVEAAVAATMAEGASRRHVRSCIRRLASDIGVEVRADRLWFRYDGRYVEGEDEGS